MNGTSVVRRLVVRGRVQGVGYRAWAQHTALQHCLEGWVRNRTDQTVEAVLMGPGTAVAGMIEACWRGPPGARVDAVDQHDGATEDVALRRRGELFSVLPTA